MRVSLRLVASAFYRFGYKLHHKLFLRPQPRLRTPVIIVGSYLAGGAGKTPFTIWLAKHIQKQNKRVAVLCHKVAWDEFILLKNQLPNIKVIATSNRYTTTKAIQDQFDIIICDDGFEDSRFTGAKRICLNWHEQPTSWTRLFPNGPFRSLKQDHDEREIIHLNCYGTNNIIPDVNFAIETLTNYTPGKPLSAKIICGLGNPNRFIEDVRAFGAHHGIVIQGSIIRPDHDKHFSQIIANELSYNDVIISQKDASRLQQEFLVHPKLHIAIQNVSVSDNAIKNINSLLS